jgi:hypothetical protein
LKSAVDLWSILLKKIAFWTYDLLSDDLYKNDDLLKKRIVHKYGWTILKTQKTQKDSM